MVKDAITDWTASRAELGLALSYAPRRWRAALTALFTLDETLGHVLRTTREPLIGQMRLTWWAGALDRLDTAPPPAEPVLQTLAAEVLPLGVSGARLATMIDGWEALLEGGLQDDVLIRHSRQRGASLFDFAAVVLGAVDQAVPAAGEGWALADLAANMADAKAAQSAQRRALDTLAPALRHRWSRPGRPLGALALLAKMDACGIRSGPRRVGRLAWHRITGR